MKPLERYKRVIFNSPLKKNSDLIRTGCIDFNNSNKNLVYASLFAKYLSRTISLINMTDKIYKEIKEQVVLNNVSDVEKLYKLYLYNLSGIYKVVDTSEIDNLSIYTATLLKKYICTSNDEERLRLIFELIPIDIFKSINSCNHIELEALVLNTIETNEKLIGVERSKIDHVKNTALVFFQDVFKLSLSSIIEDDFTIDKNAFLTKLSVKLGVDIYIMDSESRLICDKIENDFDNKIVLLKIISETDEGIEICFYEVVGELLENNNTNTFFMKSDGIIQNISNTAK